MDYNFLESKKYSKLRSVFAVEDHLPSTYHDIFVEAFRTDSRILDVGTLSVCPTGTAVTVGKADAIDCKCALQ